MLCEYAVYRERMSISLKQLIKNRFKIKDTTSLQHQTNADNLQLNAVCNQQQYLLCAEISSGCGNLTTSIDISDQPLPSSSSSMNVEKLHNLLDNAFKKLEHIEIGSKLYSTTSNRREPICIT